MNNDSLILVDDRNRAVGTASKETIHRRGMLHRAFSIFLLDAQGRLLLQKRHFDKYHSGTLWTNSCCGHPRPRTRTIFEARRRLKEEVGISAALKFGFLARYQTTLDRGITENEIVYIYFGRSDLTPDPDPREVTDIRYASLPELEKMIAREPNHFTYWLRIYMINYKQELVRCWRALQ